MTVAWTRAAVLVAVAALIGNANCFGNCASTACSSANTAPKGCHHPKPDRDTAQCSHQHSEFAGPETALVKVDLATTICIGPPISPISIAVSTNASFLSELDTGPPPGSASSSSVSVLRI